VGGPLFAEQHCALNGANWAGCAYVEGPAERLEGRMRATPVTSARARAAPILQGS